MYAYHYGEGLCEDEDCPRDHSYYSPSPWDEDEEIDAALGSLAEVGRVYSPATYSPSTEGFDVEADGTYGEWED